MHVLKYWDSEQLLPAWSLTNVVTMIPAGVAHDPNDHTGQKGHVGKAVILFVVLFTAGLSHSHSSAWVYCRNQKLLLTFLSLQLTVCKFSIELKWAAGSMPQELRQSGCYVDYLGGKEGFTGTSAHDPWKGRIIQCFHFKAKQITSWACVACHVRVPCKSKQRDRLTCLAYLESSWFGEGARHWGRLRACTQSTEFQLTLLERL